MARIGIVGAGVIGLACALALRADGHEVTAFDRDPEGDKCSWGNAGGIANSEVIPHATPGVLARVPGWLVDPLGPLAIRPAHLPHLLPWLIRFVASARPAAIERYARALATLTLRAHDDFTAMLEAIGLPHALRRVGALTVYRSQAALAREQHEWELRRRLGIEFALLTGAEARAMEPALSPAVQCGVFTPGWSQVTDPKEIWHALLTTVRRLGVAVMQADIADIDGDARLRSTDGAQHGFDRLIVAAGAWSARLARRVGDRALLESERGYNVTIAEPGITLTREIIFAEEKFVAAPLSVGLRIGGAAEFTGLDAPPNFRRAHRLHTLARRYLPDLSEAAGTVWMGQRPTTPDSLPVIGPSPASPRIVYAFGHGHVGLTLCATTARLVTDVIAGHAPPVDITPFAISRFG